MKEELLVRTFEPADQDQVIQLWRDCGLVVPQNDPAKDVARKLSFQPDLFLVGVLEDCVVATAMVGYDGHRGWINYLAVAPARRRQGFAKAIMDEAEKRLKALGCTKINLQVRTSNTKVIAFYERLGFSVDDVVGMGKRLIRDTQASGDENSP